jgi:8-oxo-dGTP pyrophosphatase MutT (NUDIX family)
MNERRVVEAGPRPSLTDRAWRLAYWVAFRLARAWWRVRRPHHHGAVIAVWLDGKILGVRQSYTNRLSWPGGGIGRGEDPTHAAQRELQEELGLAVPAEALMLVRRMTCWTDYRHDHVCIFELHLTAPPALKLDGREITRAGFMRPQDMLAVKTPEFVAAYLRDRATHARAA